MLEVALTKYQTIHITIDDREKNSDIIHFLQQDQRVILKRKRLPIGDFKINERFLLERKTLPDFVESIKDGRLFRQVRRMLDFKFIPILILEGIKSDLDGCKMSREAIQGALVSVNIVFGVPTLRSKNAKESAKLMLYTAQQVQRVHARQYPVPSKVQNNKKRAQIEFLQGIPKVGAQKASDLLDHFNTIQNIMNASQKELRQISGIGPTISKKIHWLIKDQKNNYHSMPIKKDEYTPPKKRSQIK
jgi:ERCC4-type nuclease